MSTSIFKLMKSILLIYAMKQNLLVYPMLYGIYAQNLFQGQDQLWSFVRICLKLPLFAKQKTWIELSSPSMRAKEKCTINLMKWSKKNCGERTDRSSNYVTEKMFNFTSFGGLSKTFWPNNMYCKKHRCLILS